MLNVNLKLGKEEGFAIEITGPNSARIPVDHLPRDYLDVGVIKDTSE